MQGGVLLANVEHRGLVLDPRTKLLLLITMTVFVLGGAGNRQMSLLPYVLSLLPVVLLLSAKRYQVALISTAVYFLAELAYHLAGVFLGGPAFLSCLVFAAF